MPMADDKATSGLSASSDDFRELIRRVRAGDERAATELVRQYEPEIRRAVRLRLNNPKLGRALDTIDICQSVMGRFFVGVAAGQFDLEHPGQLLRLLVTMAKNRVIDHARKPANRPESFGGDDREYRVAGKGETPSEIVSHREMLAEMRRRLSDEERKISELRHQGVDWAGIATELGGSAEAIRKKFERAIDRVTSELGIG
jgi:RNA polymerase sigma-70 factor (ECF subfamily)